MVGEAAERPLRGQLQAGVSQLCPGESEQHQRGEKHFSNTRKATLPRRAAETSLPLPPDLVCWGSDANADVPSHRSPACPALHSEHWQCPGAPSKTRNHWGQAQAGAARDPSPCRAGHQDVGPDGSCMAGKGCGGGKGPPGTPQTAPRDPQQPGVQHRGPGVARCPLRRRRS